MKILTQGRWLWTRTIGSTICGEAVDSGLVLHHSPSTVTLGSGPLLLKVMLTQYVLKTLWEVVMHAAHVSRGRVPEARRAGGLLRPVTNFTPFSLQA
jgi:uncharacterized PurR-regulated membrane protein YhhQ (DUF165 family)